MVHPAPIRNALTPFRDRFRLEPRPPSRRFKPRAQSGLATAHTFQPDPRRERAVSRRPCFWPYTEATTLPQCTDMTDHDSVRYELQDGIAVITLDDGKRNALSPSVFKGIYAALSRAEKDGAIVILTGREGVFSAGFDLKVMKAGNADALRMLHAGYSLTARIMAYPYPVIAACNGHAIAMGVFMMLSADYIIGSRGSFQVVANEVAIGLTIPRVPCTTLAQRLTPAAYQRAVVLAEPFTPEAALVAGFFDELVEPNELLDRAQALALKFSQLDMRAHAETKRRVRAQQIRRIRQQVPLDMLDAVRFALRGRKPKAPATVKA